MTWRLGMRMLRLATITIVVSFAAAGVAGEDQAGAGAAAVEVVREDWHDEARRRTVPVKMYLPRDVEGRRAVVIVSHGLGGSREGLEYVGRHWASHGYVAVHLQHRGSDETLWKNQAQPVRALQSGATGQNLILRAGDVSFAIDELIRRGKSEGDLLFGRIDDARVAVAGHSFGAHTVQAVAGQVFRVGPREMTLRDERVRCGIAFSPAPPERERERDIAFSQITIPLLHITGTRDGSPLKPMDPIERRVPFDRIDAADQYLLIFDGADHMIFNGPRRLRPQPGDERVLDLIRQFSTAFLDAHLIGDEAAVSWLTGSESAAVLGEVGVFEAK